MNTYSQVYIERKGLLELTNVTFRDDQHLLRIIDKIVSQVGRRIDESTPMVDARLSDGSRVNAIIPPLAVDGPLLSIRRFSTDKLMPPDLVDRKAMTPGMMELLEAAVKARLNIIIAGGTGSGKTTLLNALSCFINAKERIVTIEDAAELQLKQPHVARLETRPANLEGTGAVRQRELLVNSLRMRPDRIVVGEVRGEEALDMLQAMNTGHDGSLTTVHANTPRDAVSRLEVMVSLANSNMQLISIRQQIASAVHLLVQASRMSDGSRRVVSITEVTGMEGEVVTLQDLFVFEKRGLDPDGKVVGRFAATGIRPEILRKAVERRHPPAAGSVRRSGGGLTSWDSWSSRSWSGPVAMVAWFLVSKYFKSSDVDRIKQRLTGIGKAQRRRPKRARTASSPSSIPNRAATSWPRCWWKSISWVPSSQLLLEQAGLRWTPARLMHLSIMAFAAGFAFGWVVLPVPMALDLLVGLALRAGSLRLRLVRQRKSRLQKVRSTVPGNAGVRLPLHARRPCVFGVARNDPSRVPGAGVGRIPPHFRGTQPGTAHRGRVAEA